MTEKTLKAVSIECAKEITKCKRLMAQYISNKIHNELMTGYDQMIDDFYSYEPKRYRRHEDQKGVDLYRMLEGHRNQIVPTGMGSTVRNGFSAGISLNSSKIGPYRFHSPEAVADYIICKGVRFPVSELIPQMEVHEAARSEDQGDGKFNSSYTSSDGKYTASGTIFEVLQSIKDQMAVDESLQKEALDYVISTGNFKYITS